MISFRNNEQRSSLVWFLVGLGIVGYSLKYDFGTFSSPGPGFVPLFSGLAVLFLSLLVFIQESGKLSRDKVKDLWAQKDWPMTLWVLGSLAVYTLLLDVLGFLLDAFFLIAFLFRVIEPIGWKKVLVGAALTSLVSYAVFQLWLEAQLPKGIFGF